MDTIVGAIHLAKSLTGGPGRYVFAFKYALGLAKEGVDFWDATGGREI